MASTIITLNRNTDFRRTYGRGKVYTSPALVTYVAKSSAGICRVGITTSKKIPQSDKSGVPCSSASGRRQVGHRFCRKKQNKIPQKHSA